MSDRQHDLFATDPTPWEMDEAAEGLVASIALPVAPWGPFDYRVPTRLANLVEAGRRVRVPLGKSNRMIVGYCVEASHRPLGARRLKEVHAVIDAQPLLTPALMRLTHWLAEHYLCPIGQTLEGVLPSGVRSGAGERETTFLSVPAETAAQIDQLKLPKKQADALRILAASPRPMTPPELAEASGCTQAPIAALRKKGLIVAEIRRVQHADLEQRAVAREHGFTLNEEQRQALAAITSALEGRRHETLLLHGVTGSGKTEVYIRAIEEVIAFGRQAIVLVPEISLTPQTWQRFRSRFEHVALLHSHLSDVERHWHWQRIASGQTQVVVGARSAIFAPTRHLGLIVLDEEHDASFKQSSAPRYHARDVARERARLEGIPLVLGSATPSLESWQAAQEGKIRLIEMRRRIEDRPLPDVATIDLRTDIDNRGPRGAISRPLYQAMRQSLADGGQVILLLNRRGFSTHIQCPACGHVVTCLECDIALTHHRDDNVAMCHYCDYSIPAPEACPQCQFIGLRYSGIGTQRLETEVQSRFPEAASERMDSDTMRRPNAHDRALTRFRTGEAKILLGTQMIAKGLDFPNVTLVGVVNADTALHLPDFRAAERTFQLVTQVAGRTGRGEKGGRVLVQTFEPEHPAIQAAVRHDYRMFAERELPARRQYGYPPFASMIRVVVRGPDARQAEEFAEAASVELAAVFERESLSARVVGPAPAPFAILRGKHRFHMLLIAQEGERLRRLAGQVSAALRPPDEVEWVVDVDPIEML